jgi:peptidoglycan/xylan/chitin deacetylase (PgdA/CDA1 family)
MKVKCFILFCIDIFLLTILIVANSNSTEKLNRFTQTSSTVSESSANSKKVALTFDDGPHPRYTQQILAGLKERNAKATFFVIGKNAEMWPDVVKNIYDDGHLIGNHTYNHVQLNALCLKDQCAEITKANEVIYQITGESPEFIRPTFGEWDENLECMMDMIPVFWTVDTLDWKTENVDKIVKKGW